MRSPLSVNGTRRGWIFGLLVAPCLLLAQGALGACIAALDDVDAVVALLDEGGDVGGTGHRGEDDGIGGTGLIAGTSEIGDADGIGGTGLRRQEGGVGGTGLEAGEAPWPHGYHKLDNSSLDSIRAAGHAAGQQSVDVQHLAGVLTRLDDACVGGLEVELEGGRLLDDDGSATALDALRIGHVIDVDILTSGSARYASTISLRPLLEGPVTNLDAAAGMLEVMSEAIEVGAFVVIDDVESGLDIGLEEIELGDTVVVHGVRTESGRILATWMGRKERSDIASVRGVATRLDESQHTGHSLKVGRVRVAPLPDATEVAGQWVRVVGRWDPESSSLADARLVAAREQGSSASERESTDQRWSPEVQLHLGHWPPMSTR